MAAPSDIKRVGDAAWELPVSHKDGMRVPVRIYATKQLLDGMDDGVFEQITNVAGLKGIVGHAACMPDGHWGYGFPIGGTAAVDAQEGVISPGGIGFDINCGMRLLRTDLTYDEVKLRLPDLVNQLFKRVPAGVGAKGFVNLSHDEFAEVVENGAAWCIKKGFGWPEDLDRTEDGGCMPQAQASKVSFKAMERGFKQVGTLGSGNHYLEIQVVRRQNIFDADLARAFGIDRDNQIVIMFHCGSRGFGHQVATDYLQSFVKAMPKYGLSVADRELACAPLQSDEGQAYFAAMNCAINMSYANRQLIAHRVREVFGEIFGKDPRQLGMHQIYDVCHNTAKLETHHIAGVDRQVLVHRKGATRALGPGCADLPEIYRPTGQPVIIGGSMETGSYLLAGTAEASQTFFTTAHGSGRTMSRRKAKKQFHGRTLHQKMKDRGIYVRCVSFAGLAEEAGAAYKDIDEVVKATQKAGISRPVVKFLPIGNVKG